MDRVLILDDDKDMGYVLSQLLSSNVEVECLYFTGLAALQNDSQALANCFLIFLDINLGPGFPNGLDAHSWLRDLGFKGKICFLTAHAYTSPLLQRAVESGVEIFNKPVGADKLCSIVADALKARSENEIRESSKV